LKALFHQPATCGQAAHVTWMNVLNGHGAGDFAAAYAVEQIPANFLVGRDGKVDASVIPSGWGRC
jgi:hypothetical protein